MKWPSTDNELRYSLTIEKWVRFKLLNVLNGKSLFKNLKKNNFYWKKSFYTKALYAGKLNIILMGVMAELQESHILHK
jgi:hypothetical protein